MKRTILAALGLALASSAAYAADAYDRKGGLKDTGSAREESKGVSPSVVATRSGFYVSGNLGLVFDGNRSVNQRTHRENGDIEKGGTEEAPTETFVPDDISGLTNNSKSDLDDVKLFGGEVSYLFQLPERRVALEVAGGAQFYRESETTHAWTGFANFSQWNGEPSDFDSSFESAGFVKVDRKYDIDLVLKAHYFLQDRWSVYAGGGISYAKADVSGGSTNTLSPLYDNGFNNGETSWGYVVVLGSQYWLTDQIIAGLEYNYKEHEFDLGGSTTRTGADSGPFDYTSAGDNGKVKDRLHILKGKVGVHF